MRPLALRTIHRFDRACFAAFRAWHRPALEVARGASPNLRHAHLRMEPGARVRVGPGFATERQRGNHIWVQRDGELRLGRDVWLRTEHDTNRITVFPGARIEIGDRALINGAMLHSKAEIRIGADCLVGFGARIIDADMHDLDENSPERMEPVHIGERCWIASDVRILRGVKIGDDCVVGTGSIVLGDLPPRVVAVGTPAKPIREIATRKGCS